jgi:hypothetical protein
MAPAFLIGESRVVTITHAGANSLFGELAAPPLGNAAHAVLENLET